MEKQYIIPVAGQTYRNRNGGEYLCTGNTFYVDDAQKQRFLSLGEHIAYMERVKDGWRLTAHGTVRGLWILFRHMCAEKTPTA